MSVARMQERHLQSHVLQVPERARVIAGRQSPPGGWRPFCCYGWSLAHAKVGRNEFGVGSS